MKFTQNNETYLGQFSSVVDDDKNWVLDYLCGDEGAIPYEQIKSHKDLDAVPNGDFLSKTEFLKIAKNEIMYDESYESVKKFWNLMRLNKLSELNDIYNFQGTIIFFEVFKNRAIKMMQKLPYNPRKCTSPTILGKMFGTKWRNPVKLDRTRKV